MIEKTSIATEVPHVAEKSHLVRIPRKDEPNTNRFFLAGELNRRVSRGIIPVTLHSDGSPVKDAKAAEFTTEKGVVLEAYALRNYHGWIEKVMFDIKDFGQDDELEKLAVVQGSEAEKVGVIEVALNSAFSPWEGEARSRNSEGELMVVSPFLLAAIIKRIPTPIEPSGFQLINGAYHLA